MRASEDALGRGAVVLQGLVGRHFHLSLLLVTEPDTFLLLIGGGPQETAIKEMIEEYGLTSRVRLTGTVNRER